MSSDMIISKYYWQPVASSTPRKYLANRNQIKNPQSKELIKPSSLLNVLLHQNQQPVEDQENKFVTKPKSWQRESLYFQEASSSSSDEEEEKLSGGKKQPALKISSSNLKRCIDIKTDSDKIVGDIGLKMKNKSTINLSSKKATRKAGANNIRKNASAGCKTALKISPQKTKISSKSPNNSDNTFMFGKLGNTPSCVNLLDKASTKIKKGEEGKPSDEVQVKQASLDTYFMPIKNKIKANDPVVEKKPVTSVKVKSATSTHESSRKENKSTSDSVENFTKVQKPEGKNQMEIFSSPYNSDKKQKGSVKARTKTKGKTTVDVVPAKRMKTKAKTTLIENSDMKNSSHQLFSDSKNQELLNSLDLTKEDISDKQNNLGLSINVFLSSLMKSKVVPESQSIPVKDMERVKTNKTLEASTRNSDCESSEGQKKENIKSGEEAPFSQDDNDIQLRAAEEKMPVKESTQTTAEEEKQLIENLSVHYKDYKGKLRKGSVFQNGAVPKKTILKNPSQTLKKTDDGTVQNSIQNDKDQVPSSGVTVKTSKEGTAKDNKNTDDECSSKSSEVSNAQKLRLQDVFRPLNALSNKNEFKLGCAVTDCLTLKQFKCGMLQLKANSSHTSKTNDGYSYFGGVVIKGSLRMKIGETEMDLKEGDMAFVPPLTVWSVCNIHNLDGLMYYWCGRFRS